MTVTPAVISPSTSTGDAIPLMVSSTSGRNNAASYRDGLITDIAIPAASNGDAFPRPGVLGRVATATAGASGFNSLFVHAPSVPSGLSFVVEPGSAIVGSSGSSGGYLVNSKTALTLVLDPANASNPRIDLVYLQVSDILSSAASTLVQIAVVTGTPGSSPTAPALPTATTGVQYLALGTIRVPAAATNLTGATFSDLRVGTSVNGFPRPILGADLLTAAGSVPGELRVRQHTNYGTLVDRYGYDGAWHGTQSLDAPQATFTGATGSPLGTETHIGTITIPDPGWNYWVDVDWYLEGTPQAQPQNTSMFCRNGSISGTILGQEFLNTYGEFDIGFQFSRRLYSSYTARTPFSGALTLWLDVLCNGGTSALINLPTSAGVTLNASARLIPAT